MARGSFLNRIRRTAQLCEDVLVDLDDVEADLEASPATYGLDFSEVYAYMHPSRELADREGLGLRVEEGRPPNGVEGFRAESYDRVILESVLFGSEDLVMLPPHVDEFEGYAQRVNRDEVGHDVRWLSQLERQRRLIEGSDTYARLRRIAEGEEVSEGELTELVAFLEERIPTIWALATEPARSLAARLADLVERSSLRALPWADVGPLDEGIVNQAYDVLATERGGGGGHGRGFATTIDAEAVGLLHGLWEEGERLQLVTRSRALRVTAEAFGWEGRAPIRHPRAVYVLRQFQALDAERSARRLQSQRAAIRSLLDALREVDPDQGGRQTPSAYRDVVRRLADARTMWQSLLSLDAMTAPRPVSSQNVTLGVGEVLRLLSDPGALHVAIVERSDQVIRSLERLSDTIGISLLPAPRPEGLRSEAFPEKGKTVLVNSGQGFPYTLQLYSERGRRLLEVIRPGAEAEWPDIAVAFEETFVDEGSEEEEYERLLLVAYLYATAGEWEAARDHAGKALELVLTAETPAPLYPHELYFFLGVTRRKIWDASSLEEARGYVQRALELKEARTKDSGEGRGEDPRFLRELGVNHLITSRVLGRSRSRRADAAAHASRGVRYLRRALTAIDDDDWLQLQVLNSLLYHYVRDTPRSVDLATEARELLVRVEELLGAYDGESRGRQASVVDTVAWARWVLFPEDRNPREVEHRLENALDDDSLSDDERAEIEDHLYEVRRWREESREARGRVRSGRRG